MPVEVTRNYEVVPRLVAAVVFLTVYMLAWGFALTKLEYPDFLNYVALLPLGFVWFVFYNVRRVAKLEGLR